MNLEEQIKYYEEIKERLTDWYISALNIENRAAQKIIYRNYEIANKILENLYKQNKKAK